MYYWIEESFFHLAQAEQKLALTREEFYPNF